MSDFKSAYSHLWSVSAQREVRTVAAVEAVLPGTVFRAQGLGAGSSERVEGYSRDRGQLPGTADCVSACGRLELESTGSTKPIPEHLDLWIRPDKLAAARAGLAAGRLTVVAHELPRADAEPLVRWIVLDATFLNRAASGEFQVISARPNGMAERFTSIPARDEAVMTLSQCVPAMLAALAGTMPTTELLAAPVQAAFQRVSTPYTGPFTGGYKSPPLVMRPYVSPAKTVKPLPPRSVVPPPPPLCRPPARVAS